jgi:hypothetical protein
MTIESMSSRLTWTGSQFQVVINPGDGQDKFRAGLSAQSGGAAHLVKGASVVGKTYSGQIMEVSVAGFTIPSDQNPDYRERQARIYGFVMTAVTIALTGAWIVLGRLRQRPTS